MLAFLQWAPESCRTREESTLAPRTISFAFAVGLAIVLSLFRIKRTVRSDEADLLRN